MRPRLLALLCCPDCRADLQIALTHAEDSSRRIRDGLLVCSGCGATYPIVGWVPRLLPSDQLTASEKGAIGCAGTADVEVGRIKDGHSPQIVSMPSPEDALKQIERMVRAKVLPANLPPKLCARAERNVEYLLHHSDDKRKFVLTVLPHVKGEIRIVADLGGGQGGTLTAFREEFHPEVSLLVDIDPEWVEVAVLREPENDVVRGDGTRLLIKDGALDLLVTTAALEHIPDWKAAVGEMCRTARQALLCYGPNGAFPYDFGHLDAPFVTWLPPRLGSYVAKVYHWIRGTGRTLASIRHEREVTFFIPRRSVVRELRSAGIEPRNVFDEFLRHSVKQSYHMHASGFKRTLARRNGLRRIFSSMMLAAGMEPNVYLFFEGAQSGTAPLGVRDSEE